TQSPTGNLIANLNRIGCQIRFAIRSVNHCRTIHYRSSRYHLARWILSYPMSQKSHSIRSYQTNHSSPTIHCCQSYRWTRSIRWSLSCRFARRTQSFRWIQEGCRIQMARCCRSIPRSHLNPTSQTSR
ncbi:MAG: hypothetical protein ACK52I_34110, partial [Pseudomonadota bacterium]